MWNYEKRLQYPVKISQTNPQMAQVIISQFGGPDGELSASMRYLSQRYTMPYKEVTGILTDIGTEELAHMEMICAIVSTNTMWITRLLCGHSRPVVCHGVPQPSSPKVIQLPICTRIWQPNRKPARPMTISSVW